MPLNRIEVYAKMRQYDRDGLTTNKADPDLSPFVDDALLIVPVAKLGNRANLATAYYSLYLMGGAVGVTGGGAVKREKSGDVEVEYAVSAEGRSTGSWYLDQYKALLGGRSRNSPRVLGVCGG
jgi:hypothetical protein